MKVLNGVSRRERVDVGAVGVGGRECTGVVDLVAVVSIFASRRKKKLFQVGEIRLIAGYPEPFGVSKFGMFS